MDAPDLIIPIRLDRSHIQGDLQGLQADLNSQAQAAAQAQQQASNQVSQSAQRAAAASRRRHRESMAFIEKTRADLAAKAKAKAEEQAAAEKKAADDAMRAWKESMDAQHRQAMQNWAEHQAQLKAEAEEEARRIATHKEANDLLTKLDKERTEEVKQAAKAAFNAWKDTEDGRHRQEMQSWAEHQAQLKAKERADKEAAKAEFQAWKNTHDALHAQEMQRWEEQQAIAARQKALFAEVRKVALGAAVAITHAFVEGMRAVAESVDNARQHIKSMVSEMEGARKELKELAALRGQSATAGFSAQIAREAASAGIDVDKYQQFSTAWEAYAGQYVGGSGETPQQLAAQGKKLNKEQALELQKRVAGYSMGARGLSAEDSAQLMSLIVAKSAAGASSDEIMSNYAKMMRVAELAPGQTSPLLGQITEMGMENVGPQGDMASVLDAATLVRVMAQRNPAEAATYSRALLRGMREIRLDPKKMEQLGIKRGMNFRQQLAAIDQAVQKHVAAGGDQGEFLSKYFQDIREWGGISTAINEGLHGGAFQRAAAEAATVNAQTAEAATQKYRQDQEGRAAIDRAEEIAAARENSGRYVELRHIQSEARKAILAGREMEIPEGMMDAFLTRKGEEWKQGGRFEQAERRTVGHILRQKLLMSHEGRRWLIEHNPDAKKSDEIWPTNDPNVERRRAEFASEGDQIFGTTTPEHLLADAANTLRKIHDNQQRQANRPMVIQQPPGRHR